MDLLLEKCVCVFHAFLAEEMKIGRNLTFPRLFYIVKPLKSYRRGLVCVFSKRGSRVLALYVFVMRGCSRSLPSEERHA